jgi:pimeloyl-ACP methyl ester carboxylesterase
MQSKAAPRQTDRQPQGTPRRRGLGFWIRRGLVWTIAGLLALAVIGAIYQAIATEIDQQEAFPGPGEMVDVGEHRLHLNCVGQGSPTVVLDGGLGYTSVEWSGWVQPEVASHTRVCAYDRAGMGWSEPGPGSPNATQTVDELHALLQEAGEEGPYVLVGHSIAGLYSRVYAERYPEEVAGMVLVDSSHPDQFEGSGLAVMMNRAMGVGGPLISRAGIPRVFNLYSSNPELPSLQREQSDSLYYTTPHLVATYEEMGTMPESLEKARGTGTLGEKPLMVVSAAADHGAEARAFQEDLTALSSNSSQRVVEGSTHVSLVVDRGHARQTGEEIMEVVEAVRTDQPLTRQKEN